MSASEAAGKRSLTVRLSFFLSAPDSLWCDFASTAFLNIFCVSVSVCFAEPKAKSYVRVTLFRDFGKYEVSGKEVWRCVKDIGNKDFL